MKKKNNSIFYLLLLIFISSCSGYKPIFNTANIDFQISGHSIEGDQKIGKIIYSKLNYLTKKNTNKKKKIIIKIKAKKEKKTTSKDKAGKILEYRLYLNTQIEVKNYLNNNVLLNHTFSDSSVFKVQDQYSETLRLETKALDNLINKTYQDLLIIITETVLKK